MGRPRKPAVVREREGNRSRTPIPREPQGHGKPAPPAYLSPEQRACFVAVVKMAPAGLLCLADQVVCERMAVSWCTFRECTRVLAKEGLVVRGHDERPARNPLLIVMRQAADELERAGAALGMSPIARTRLRAPEPQDDDPLAQLFRLNGWDERDRTGGGIKSPSGTATRL